MDNRAVLRAIAVRVGRGALLLDIPACAVQCIATGTRAGDSRLYRPGELRSRVQCAGLQVIEAEDVDSIGFVATLTCRVFGGHSGEIDPSVLRVSCGGVFAANRKMDTLLWRSVGNYLVLIARPQEKTAAQ